VKDFYHHASIHLLAVAAGWMSPDAEFKREISPIMEAILIATIVNDDECKILLYHYVLYNIFTNYINFFLY
jgi:hypothetical protein